MIYFIYILATFGLGFWMMYKTPISHEKLPQFFQKLLSCPFCTGFWAGWIMYLLMFSAELAFTTQTIGFDLAKVIAHGFSGTVILYVGLLLLDRIEPSE